ncbi:MAG: caspase family protein [Bacteroidota bacterium]
MSERNIYVLGIGINGYQSDNIGDLNECEHDIERMKKVLMDRLEIPEKNYKLLKGAEATRKGIIEAFQTHFGQLDNGDVALLNYSGHGSWEYANQAFIDAGLEPEGGHFESLVPVDAQINGTRNIADKEIRWLVNELQYDASGNYRNIHFTAILDCCHSGSMIRFDEPGIKMRKHVGIRAPRPLHELAGPYEKMLQAAQPQKAKKKEDLSIEKDLRLPEVNYITLTGCSPLQTSIEVGGEGGIFTSSLIKALKYSSRGNRFPTYSELYSTTRAILKNNPYNEQTPQFEYAGEASPHDCFLLNGDKELARLPALVKENGKWKISLGAIHGVTFRPTKPTTLQVYEKGDLSTSLGTVRTTGIEVEFTPVKEVTAKLNPKKTYLAEFSGSKMLLKLDLAVGPPTAKKAVTEMIASPMYNQFFQFSDTAEKTLLLTENSLEIHQELNGEKKLIVGVDNHAEDALKFILSWLQRMAKWEQMKGVDAPSTSKLKQENFTLSFSYYDYDYSEKVFEIPNAKENGKGVFRTQVTYDKEKGGKPFLLNLKSESSHCVYAYLFHLDRLYGVHQVYENFNNPICMGERVELYDSSLKNRVLGIADDELDSALNTFILILSKEALNIPQAVEQDGLSGTRGKVLSDIERRNLLSSKKKRSDGDVPAFAGAPANWTMLKLEVEVVREKYKG